MGLAPLHRWSIAVYNYSPTYITAYISIVAKISIGSFIYINANLFNHNILIIFFYISLFISAYKPLYQVNIKTILAYSGILNFGYILLTIISYDISFYVYIIQYALTHMILFLGLLSASQYIEKPVSKWSPLLYIHQLKLPNLTLAFSLILALFSLIGIPPLPGFYAKLYVISGALQDNYTLEVCTIVVCSVVATYYYSNIIKILMTSSNDNNIIKVNNINISIAYILAISIILLLSFFIYLPYILEGLYLITI
jgi:NADH:ubiquinone oxidoreductase subunit 2 (subunit N)